MSHCDSNNVDSENWERFPCPELFQPELSVWISEAEEDRRWDEFLLGTEQGQFQQSSAWARVKRLDGWRATRFIVRYNEQVLAGFQILWRTKFGIRLGFLSKGPVLVAPEKFNPTEAVSLLKSATRHLRLLLLIAQPPDFSKDLEPAMSDAGFMANRIQSVFDATVFVELSEPFENVEKHYSRSTRKKIHKAQNGGVKARFAALKESPLFYDLMCLTCKRLGVKPNPSSSESIRSIIEEFSSLELQNPTAGAKILFSEVEGKTISGQLLIRFGQTVSLWKTGWTGEAEHLNVSKLLYHESMRWGSAAGCKKAELVGCDRNTAEMFQSHDGGLALGVKSEDRIKLDFGGTPMLLPKSKVWIPSPFIRIAYQIFLKLRMLRAHT